MVILSTDDQISMIDLVPSNLEHFVLLKENDLRSYFAGYWIQDLNIYIYKYKYLIT